MNRVIKIKLIINNDIYEIRKNQYKFIRDSQYAQYQGLNRCMGYLVMGYYANNMDFKSEGFKEHQKTITNSASFFDGVNFGTGIDTKSLITQKIKKDFSIAIKNGLASGERSVNNYKRTSPLMTRGRNLKFKYDENNKDILVDWINKIQFKCILGEKKNSLELKQILSKVINEEYSISQSSLYFNDKNELILMLTLKIPIEKEKYIPVKDRALEVNFGMEVPICMYISDKPYIKEILGDFSEFNRMRLQFKARSQRLYKQLKYSKGGRGKTDKFKSIEQFREKQRNFIKTYNHFLSKNIIEFALKNRCEYIYLEKLNKDIINKLALSNWNYYNLQEQIMYKAERHSIMVVV
ncbi:transposase [Clostridium beijerinckii]|uniref:transposase n=1 Tax=Clostridium beijerinckii TaxID=1520 RepID=UPI0003D33D99|nr:transposase [Clostridium beijerinckii]AQS18270.1 transposase [Clostridium beijerinckii NRRL B-598]